MKELKEINIEENKNIMPLIALRGRVLLPGSVLNFDVGRQQSIIALEKSVKFGSVLFISAQLNAFIDNPEEKDLSVVGVVVKITNKVKMPSGNVKVTVKSLYRAKIEKFLTFDGCFMVETMRADYINTANEVETEAHFRVAKNAFYEYSLYDKRITKEMLGAIVDMKDENAFIDSALSTLSGPETEVQKVLDEDDTFERLKLFCTLIKKQVEICKIEKRINSNVRQTIDKSQKEYYLREQIRAIHAELGDDQDEKELLSKQIKDKKLPLEIEQKALKEIARLEKINPSSPDYSIILNYIDWIKDTPFNECTEDTESLEHARKVLDEDHFGLEKVKERIVEYIAVLQLTKKIKGPILCFVGPPGVGKTSVATSIARALNRKFVRMSLGGVKDEAEIRGHRRTYVGAMPGRIVYGLKNAGASNPVFLLDEIDKLSSDIHGDPASALLEVLDPEQNVTFRDRYMEVPIDLSKVMFITTANSLDTIPYPLLDRMEVIELTGYTDEEKLQIAKRYLIPKNLKNNGLSEKKVEFTDGGIREIITGYTMEAGVRNLEREISSVIRKIATKVAVNKRLRKQTVKKENVADYLGRKKYIKDEGLEKDEIGTATGLAWTAVGGTTLAIEVCLMHGKGEILLTGKLGDVMKESAKTAISYIRANAETYGLAPSVFENTDIHIHVPEGATPKDGPSAGITMATAILSAFIKKPIKKSVAMTGEITLRGKVLPIGGLKEKALAGYRNGIKTIVIPKKNQRDTEDIPEEIRKEIKFVPVEDVREVFETAIEF